jgi:hypothetical protein
MTTAADLLKKAESRGKTPHIFQPQKRRAWDYAVQEIAVSEEIVQKENRNESGNNWVHKSEQSENKNRNNWVQISEQSGYENKNEYRNNLPQEAGQDKKLNASKSVENLPSLHNENFETNVLKVLRKITGHQQKIMGQITAHIKSLPFSGGACTMPAPKVYTGTMVKGIATMHKSNAVPVFSDEQAVDISRMRR